MLISIKRFLDHAEPKHVGTDDLLEAALQMGRLLIEGIATHSIRGRDADFCSLVNSLKSLSQKVDQRLSALHLLETSTEAIKCLESYSGRTEAYLRDQRQQMQSILGMLADTLADISSHADNSVAQLQAIEQQVKRASQLDDIRALSASLENCLIEIREAAAQQRRLSAVTVQRLRSQLALAQERAGPQPKHFELSELEGDLEHQKKPPTEAPKEYVAVVRLQRADSIATQFGEPAKQTMLSLMSESLNNILGPNDRLLRWKGTSFVLFLKSSATVGKIRAALAEAISHTRPYCAEHGKKTVSLAVLADWIVFPQAECLSLEAVFHKVDSFLDATSTAGS